MTDRTLLEAYHLENLYFFARLCVHMFSKGRRSWNIIPTILVRVMVSENIQEKKNNTPTSEQEEDESHDQGIAKVEDGAGQSGDLQLGEEVMNGVDEEIKSSEAACQEGTPLPVVVLCRRDKVRCLEKHGEEKYVQQALTEC